MLGDPTSPDTKLGPMESVEARDNIADQVERSLAAGARLLLGGEIPGRPGALVSRHRWLTRRSVKPSRPHFDEEVFGPVSRDHLLACGDEAGRGPHRQRQ